VSLYDRLGAGQRTDRGPRREASAALPKTLAGYELLIVDELGFVPCPRPAAELLFETFSQRYERASTLVTSNLPSKNGPKSSAPNGYRALLDRLTHHVHILEMNGDSYRLKQSRRKRTLLPNAEIPHRRAARGSRRS